MNVAKDAAASKSAPAQTARKRVEQLAYWPCVTITSDAQARLGSLEIQYGSFGRAMQATVASLVESIRKGETAGVGFCQIPLMAMDDLPSDITIVYQHSKDALVIVDVRRPDQPALF